MPQNVGGLDYFRSSAFWGVKKIKKVSADSRGEGRFGMKKLSWVLICFSMVLVSCNSDQPSVLSKTTQTINLEVGITVGNHAYLPINIDGRPDDHVREILRTLESFEQKHPELEIISWNIEKQQNALATPAYIRGIWVSTRPKRPAI